MNLRQTKFRPLLCCCGVATLLIWIGAQVLCEAHCLLNSCEDETDSGNMASVLPMAEHSSPADHHDDKPNPGCATIKSAFHQKTADVCAVPIFSFSYLILFTAPSLEATTIEPVTRASRQPPDREFVFTPEVSLGAAFRSLAPPVLA